MALTLTFCGGAEKVTGSNFLVENDSAKVLVDCGIEQGKDFCESCTYGAFPYDPSSIHALVVTHAHLDHIGRIPKLVREGFLGPIYMTPPTKDLATLIWHDSVDILYAEAKKLKRDPLYDATDVDKTLALIALLPYRETKEIAPGISLRFFVTGHILGSAGVFLTDRDGTSLAITSDLGNSPSPLLPDWDKVEDADALVLESVYGNRVHPAHEHRVEHLREALGAAIARGGAILIPAFSLERTQLMLYELSNFFAAGVLPPTPVFLDSPLAIAVTSVYEKWGKEYFKTQTKEEIKKEGSIFEFPFLVKTKDSRDSEKVDASPNPKIIIAGAGMSHGGRIGKHEIKYLPDPHSTLFIVGYQAPGSPGRMLQDGASRITINGQTVPVRARVETLEGWSAHTDRDGLLAFAEAALRTKRTKITLVALGEPSAARFLAQRIHDYLGGRVAVPQEGERWRIEKDAVRKL